MDAFFRLVVQCYYDSNYNVRLGQALWMSLPDWSTKIITGTKFDPYFSEFGRIYLHEWISNHLIFDENEIIAVFDGNNIIAEKPTYSIV